MADLTEKVTLTYEGHGQVYTASFTANPLTVPKLQDWFEQQALPALGFPASQQECVE